LTKGGLTVLSGQVLVATDFSDEANMLKERLIEFKEAGLEKILLTHVLELKLTKKMGGVEEIKKKLADIAKEYQKAGLEVETEILKGDPAIKLKELADEKNCSLMLIASHGQSFIKDIPIGHTAYNIARQVKTPLIIDKFKNYADKDFLQSDNNLSGLELISPKIFNRLLLPLDLSSASAKVVEMVKSLKGNAEFTKIELLHVIESSIDEDDLDDQISNARKELNKLSDYLRKHNLTNEVEIKIEEGTASDKINEVAKEEKISLIMMTKSGENFPEIKLLGSTTDTVIKDSSIPVLTVPPSIY